MRGLVRVLVTRLLLLITLMVWSPRVVVHLRFSLTMDILLALTLLIVIILGICCLSQLCFFLLKLRLCIINLLLDLLVIILSFILFF